MSTQLRFRRGNTTQTNAFTGALAEVTVDTDKNVVVVHDGSTPGGFPAPKLSYVQAAFDAANSALAGGGEAGTFAQAAYNTANSAYNQANLSGYFANTAWADANTRVSKSGDTITGSLVVTQNLSANLIIAEHQFFSGDATRLATPLPNLIAQFTSSSDAYVQVNAQNINPNGSADFVSTADIGSDTEFYIDMGMVGSAFVNTSPYNSIGTAAFPLDGYLYVQGSTDGRMGGNLIIGTTSNQAPTNIRLLVGGVNEENVVATFDSTGNTIIHGHLLPHQADTWEIGSADTPWHSIWLGPGSLNIGTIKLSQNTITGELVITGASDILLANTTVPKTSTISNTANAAFIQANAAFEVANSASIYANGAFIQANAGFEAANSSGVYANGAFIQANAGFEVANSSSIYANGSFVQANAAFIHANAAFEAANNVFPQVQPAFDTANAASIYANGAFAQANASFEVANSASIYANGAFIQANAAFAVANNSLNVATGGTVTGDVTITGNLTINGTTTTVNTTTVQVTDSLIKLANNNTSGDALDIGFYGLYDDGATKYTGLIRQAAGNYFLFHELTNDPTGNTLAPGSVTPANTATLVANVNSYQITINGRDVESYLQSAFDAANTADSKAVTAGSYANSAFIRANAASIQANASFEVANSASVYANGAFDTANSAGVYANGAFVQANAAFNTANSKVSKSGDTMTGRLHIANTTGSSSNSTGALTIDGGVGLKGALYGDALYDSGFRVLTIANAAFESGNSGIAAAIVASYYANLAYVQANSAYDTANASFIQANAAFEKANSGILTTKNEGVTLTTTTQTIDFVGGGVNATNSGNVVTVNVKSLFDYEFDPYRFLITDSAGKIIDSNNILEITTGHMSVNVRTEYVIGAGMAGEYYQSWIKDDGTHVMDVGVYAAGYAGHSYTTMEWYAPGTGQTMATFNSTGNVTIYGTTGPTDLGSNYDNGRTLFVNGDLEARDLYMNVSHAGGIHFTDGTYQNTAAYPLTIKEEGSVVVANTAKEINFVGAAITATASGNSVTVTVSNSAFVQANAAYDKANSVIDTVTTVVSTTSPTTVYTFDKATYRTTKSIAQMTKGTEYHSIELMLIHDGTNVYLSQYGEIKTGNNLGSFDASISGSNVEIQVTTTGSPTTVIVSTQRMPV